MIFNIQWNQNLLFFWHAGMIEQGASAETRFFSSSRSFFNFCFFINENKTPGYLLDFLRPPTLIKMPFRGMKAFFSKYSVSPSYFLTFPALIFFLWFLPKNLKNKIERHFQGKIPFETHSGKKLPHVAILKNFKVFFRIKPKFWTFRGFLLFQSHSAANSLLFSEKKISRSETWTSIVLVWSQLANFG